MKSFNTDATSLTVSFICEETKEKICLHIEDMPEPNWYADSINDSVNSIEEEFDGNNGHRYKIVIYKDLSNGNLEVFDVTNDEIEIEDFEIEVPNMDDK